MRDFDFVTDSPNFSRIVFGDLLLARRFAWRLQQANGKERRVTARGGTKTAARDTGVVFANADASCTASTWKHSKNWLT